MKIQVAVAFAFFTLAPITATAQTQEEQQACTDDAYNFCGQVIPDRDRVAAWLHQNLNRISSACRIVMQRYSKSASDPREKITSTKQ